MKALFLLSVLLVNVHASAEEVHCVQEGVTTSDSTHVDIQPRYSEDFPSSAPTPYVRIKNESRRWNFHYSVKRSKKGQITSYKDTPYAESFALEIQSPVARGEGLKAVAYLNRGRAFEQKIEGLACSFKGEPSPPEFVCPLAKHLDASLIQASRNDYAGTLLSLIDCGASANSKDAKGCTPIQHVTDLSCGYVASSDAPSSGSRSSMVLSELLTALLDSGADLESKDPVNGQTPLIKLARYKQREALALLLDRKANVNAQDNSGDTAIMYAASFGDTMAVKILLEKRPNLGLKNAAGQTAFAIAKERGFVALLDLLKPQAVAKVQTVEGKADGSCTPKMVHIFKDKAVEIVLKAPASDMFLLVAPDLGIELMAMPGESVSQTITPDKKGTFPYTCGVHGGDEQTHGGFMVM